MVKDRLYKTASSLALFTIGYNLAEGLISVLFGVEDGSLSLAGFGFDSFIEVISGIGIAHMILRIKNNSEISNDGFERTALRITGFSFYILVAGLLISVISNVLSGRNPVTTLPGIIVSLISILVMLILLRAKLKVGKQLDSEAILADAECTRVCIYMSGILLLSSTVFQITKLPYIDSAGTLGLAYYSFREGRECFEKAKPDPDQ